MLTTYPEHPSRGKLPQVPDFLHWLSASHAILIAGFTGEPIDLNLDPAYLAPLGTWQQVDFFAFLTIYVIYIFLSLILLLNLLIALLGNAFRKTQEEATLLGRAAFARIVLRLEHIAEFLSIDSSAGEREEDGRRVHNFRTVVRDRDGEARPADRDENVFDPVPEEALKEAGSEKSSKAAPSQPAPLPAQAVAVRPKAVTSSTKSPVARRRRTPSAQNGSSLASVLTHGEHQLRRPQGTVWTNAHC
jgi:hypothetical protein